MTPGSSPIDESAITTGALWNGEHQPTAPGNLQITLTPVRHLTVFDFVQGTFSLDLTAAGKPSAHELWRCSFTTQLELIDHESVLPELWVLRQTGRPGALTSRLSVAIPFHAVAPGELETLEVKRLGE